jgi:hypothetical protein
MTFSNSTTEKPSLEDPNGFSLVRGGPLYRFWRRIGLAGDAPELLGRRIVVLAALDCQESFCIGHGAFDLEPVAHDAGIAHQYLATSGREAGDASGVEFRECHTVGVALVQDRFPAKARLGTFQRDELEQHASSCTGTPHSAS